MPLRYYMMRNFTITLLLSFIFSGNLVAQTEWKWDSHNIAFSTPENFKVSTNNDNIFQAENNEISLTIAPWQDKAVNDATIVDALVKLAADMAYDDITDARKLAFEKFSGYGINGKKGEDNAAILILINTESSSNIVVIIAYSVAAEKSASEILSSLHSIK